LADPTRIRLVALLDQHELSVAELGAATGLAQPRISTHLGKLLAANLVQTRRTGTSTHYRFIERSLSPQGLRIWVDLRDSLNDPVIKQDAARVLTVIRHRGVGQRWVDSVAGDMQRHYSPGRTWESTARALATLVRDDDILDIASGDGMLAHLLAPQVNRFVCVEINAKAVAAGQQQLANVENVRFLRGDMHALPIADASFGTCLLLHALTYTRQPARVLAEATRVLRPGGRLLCMTLARHDQQEAVAAFDHDNHGFSDSEMTSHARQAGLVVESCRVVSTEQRPPYFQVLLLKGTRPT